MLLQFARTGTPAALVVGLGNPGREYAGTRHNIGWRALDAAAAAWGAEIVKSRFHALVGEAAVDGQRLLLMKPQTFMNASGQAVAEAARFYKLAPQQIIVLSDDVNLTVGVLRIRAAGSAGGHNGLKSIIACLGSQEFGRLRIGVGQKPRADYDLADWVLGRFDEADNRLLDARLPDVVAALQLMAAGHTDRAISRYNGAGAMAKPAKPEKPEIEAKAAKPEKASTTENLENVEKATDTNKETATEKPEPEA